VRNTGSILCCVSKGRADRLMRGGNNGGGGGAAGGSPSGGSGGFGLPQISRSALFDSGSRRQQRAARSGPGRSARSSRKALVIVFLCVWGEALSASVC